METGYDASAMQIRAAEMLSKCNAGQRAAFEEVTAALGRPAAEAKCFFLYACGGSGKTILLDLLLAHVRGQGQIAGRVVANGCECAACSMSDGGSCLFFWVVAKW